jgi:cytochrome c peroxidase
MAHRAQILQIICIFFESTPVYTAMQSLMSLFRGLFQRNLALIALYLCIISASSAAPLGLPPLHIPDDNPQTPEKIALGKVLFDDARFSSTGEVACKTCHLGGIAFHDGRPVPRGVKMVKGTRNAPTVINTAYMKTLFWDGRSDSLEDQASQPLFNPVEHGLSSDDDVLKVIRNDPNYIAMFKAAFDVDQQAIAVSHFSRAIASYERTLISGDSPFDRWYFGGEENALSTQEKRGFEVFTGVGNCASCHTIADSYALFTDQKFHNVNVNFEVLGRQAPKVAETFLAIQGGNLDHEVLTDQQISELGRFTVTQRREDIGAFITPGLRNIARTSPYMHDGSLNTLEKVVRFFNYGGHMKINTKTNNPYLSPLVKPLNLSAQQQLDLIAFLESLTSPEYEVSR